MTEQEVIEMRDLTEAGKIQFKERIFKTDKDRYDIGCEMVAFSNSHGGKLIIGINDKSGHINALSYMELQETTNLLSNIASENVIPNVLIEIDTTAVTGGGVVIATIPEGKNKPYHDNKGVIWVKNGADKRKVFDNSELAEMMSECGRFNPDEAAVPNASIDDLDPETIKLFLMSRFEPVFRDKAIDELNMKNFTLDQMAQYVIKGTTIERLLQNLRLIRPDGNLTVAAMILFGKCTQRWLPTMTAKCISFFGNSVGGTLFRDKMHDMEIEGNILHQFKTIMNFFTRNLKKIQVEKEFNSLGEIEVPRQSLTEYTVNALVHRSLNIKAPIRIFIFDDRVEIHSPGSLPNNLTIEDITNGTSMPRNNLLFTNAIFLLPYTGAGSGIRRALEAAPNVIISNGIENRDITHNANEFLITIPRKGDIPYSDNSQTDADTYLACEPESVKTDPTQQKTDPVQQKTDPVHEKTDPVQQKTDPVQQKTDPAHAKTDPVHAKTDPVHAKTDPVHAKSDPVQAKSDPAQAKTDPVQQKTDPAPEGKYKMSKKQLDIRNFCSVPRSRAEILQRAGVSDHFYNRSKYIYELVEAGILERTIPNKPNDPNQKYRRKS